MSMKRLANMAALNASTTPSSYLIPINLGGSMVGGISILHQHTFRALNTNRVSGLGSNGGGSNSINANVNMLLGGAMLSVVITVICVVCYCCHRNIRKRTEAAYRQRWMENEANMEIYSVEQCYETSGLFMESSEGLPALNHEPPPSYDAVVAMDDGISRISPPPGYCSTSDICSDFKNENIRSPLSRTELGLMKISNSESCCSLQRAAEMNIAAGCSDANAAIRRFMPGGSRSLPMVVNDVINNKNNNNNNNGNTTYYHGCPLCGKFSYEDHSSLSTESSLDNFPGCSYTLDKSYNNNSMEACDCSLSLSRYTNDNDNNGNVDLESSSIYQTENNITMMTTGDDIILQSSNNNINNNNNSPTLNDNHISYMVASQSNAIPSESTSIIVDSTAVDTSNPMPQNQQPQPSSSLDLDSINDNGIIRVDMSKIIDKTGLPTYEAAIKLESSGYV